MVVVPKRHISIFCLNMAQGLPGSFFAIGLPALLRESGAGLDMVALAYLVWAPWALKWLWGPLLEQPASIFVTIFGRIQVLPLITACAFVLLVAFPVTGTLWPIFAVGIACSFTGATMQMLVGRWIMLMEPDETCRAHLNATQVAGMITGAMIGGTMIVALADWLSWTMAVISVAVIIGAMALPFAMTERDFVAKMDRSALTKSRLTASEYVTPLRTFFARRGVGYLLGLMFMSDIATGTDVFLTALLVDAGYSAATATFILNTIAMVIILPATAFAGRALQTLGTGPVLTSLLAVKAAILIVLAVEAFPGASARAILATASIVVSSVVAIAYWQIYMRYARQKYAAADIGLLTSLRTCFLMIGGIGAGQISGFLGYTGIYAVAAAFTIVAALLAATVVQAGSRFDEQA